MNESSVYSQQTERGLEDFRLSLYQQTNENIHVQKQEVEY